MAVPTDAPPKNIYRDPSIEMEEDGEYLRQLSLFVQSCTEKGIELVKIGELIADLNQRRSFLDIGAGGGDLTIPVSSSFESTTVVEPNELQAHRLRRRCPTFRVINDRWDNVDLGAERFEFILCSHVLYYVPEGTWLATIEKMHDHLEPGGRIAIVIQSPIGEVAEFFSRFAQYDVNILGLWGELIRKYGDESVEVRYFINEIFTENLEDMVSIGLFLLIDRNYRRHEDEIRKYFEARHKTPEGYRLRQDDILLVIRK
ncbi:MAG: class I SAM-dependent methyltransferase [Syntrophaceae bacterium]|nr:class I SAM-dependent methyltransferase [Syntrophaceae bacterium]